MSSTTADSYVAKVKLNGKTFPISPTLKGTCDTDASTATKTVTLKDFDIPIDGSDVTVKFTYSNTAVNPMLKVNNTDPYPIYTYGTTAPGNTPDTSWYAGSVITFMFDSSSNAWIMKDWSSAGSDNDYTAGNGINISQNNAISVNFGTTANTVCAGNDSRITNLGTAATRNASDTYSVNSQLMSGNAVYEAISDLNDHENMVKIVRKKSLELDDRPHSWQIVLSGGYYTYEDETTHDDIGYVQKNPGVECICEYYNDQFDDDLPNTKIMPTLRLSDLFIENPGDSDYTNDYLEISRRNIKSSGYFVDTENHITPFKSVGDMATAINNMSGAVENALTANSIGNGLIMDNSYLTVNFGNSANTACKGNDYRLSDARTPLSHTHTTSQITDFPTLGTAATRNASDTYDASSSSLMSGQAVADALSDLGGISDLADTISVDTTNHTISTASGYELIVGDVSMNPTTGDIYPTNGTWGDSSYTSLINIAEDLSDITSVADMAYEMDNGDIYVTRDAGVIGVADLENTNAWDPNSQYSSLKDYIASVSDSLSSLDYVVSNIDSGYFTIGQREFGIGSLSLVDGDVQLSSGYWDGVNGSYDSLRSIILDIYTRIANIEAQLPSS